MEPSAVLEAGIIRSDCRQQRDQIRLAFIGDAANVCQFVRHQERKFERIWTGDHKGLMSERIEHPIDRRHLVPPFQEHRSLHAVRRLPFRAIDPEDNARHRS